MCGRTMALGTELEFRCLFILLDGYSRFPDKLLHKSLATFRK